MEISVVCGSRANNTELLLKFIQSLNSQDYPDFDVNIVCDRNFSERERKQFTKSFQGQKIGIFDRVKFFSNINSDFDSKHSGGASYVRNFGLKYAKGNYILLLDDDDYIESDFLSKCLEKYAEYHLTQKSECVILPSLYYRDTGQIQNQGFYKFNYRMSRPSVYFLNWKTASQVQMFSGNGLFSSASTLCKVQYDENIARICEDMDYTISLHEKGVQLRVFSDLIVQHFERDKTKLEQARIGNYSQAKQKSRNRFLFVKKHGNKKQIFQFFLCGLPGCIIRLSFKAIIWGGKNKFLIIKGLRDGVFEGLKFFFKK